MSPTPEGWAEARVRPLVVEFAGTPRAGKTTALDGLAARLRELDRKVVVVEEGAGACPVRSKRDPLFNLWTANWTINRIVEVQQEDTDVVLVDRGVLDALCWMNWYYRSGMLSTRHHQAWEGFLCAGPAAGMISLVVLMTVDPDVAIAREPAPRPNGKPGPIVNRETLAAMNSCIADVAVRSAEDFTLVRLDTTSWSRRRTLTVVDNIVMSRLQRALEQTSVLPGPATTCQPFV